MHKTLLSLSKPIISLNTTIQTACKAVLVDVDIKTYNMDVNKFETAMMQNICIMAIHDSRASILTRLL